MNRSEISRRWAELESARKQVAERERLLSSAVRVYLEDRPVRSLAIAMGVSAAYVSDVRNGRRGVSEEFLNKLMQVQP